jgi:thermitase
MKKLLIILSFMFTFSLLAQEKKYVFVEINPFVDTNWNSVQKRHLFKNWYAVREDLAEKAINKEFGSLAPRRYLRNSKRSPRFLPKARYVQTAFDVKKTFSIFNDPSADRFYPILDSVNNGISMEKSYVKFPHQGTDSLIIVAVVDTGVDYNHPDLKNVIWTNEDEIPANGIDDDKNGYVDDIHGINTLVRDASGKPTSDPIDGHYHGTHVAGIIAAQHNNKIGLAGVSSHAIIMPIRTVPADADETDLDVVDAYIYAAKNGAKVINCSFGKSVSEGGTIVKEAIDFIYKNYGTVVVAAAGNDSFGPMNWFDIDVDKKYPASWNNPSLLTIASSTKSGSLSSFSNVGAKTVEFAAPGSDIFSTLPNGKYGNLSGTSMATPVASGVVAEIMSRYPNLSGVQIRDILVNTVSPRKAFNDKMNGAGIVDLFSALEHISNTH